jgi:hypothetical protein
MYLTLMKELMTKLLRLLLGLLMSSVAFLRNSIYYVNVGSGRYVYSDPLNSVRHILGYVASDAGCIAKRSIVSANGGIYVLYRIMVCMQ